MLTAKVGKVGKVLICGMKGVGKTTILEQLIHGNVTIDTEIHPTIEDIYEASVDVGRGSRETIRIYDTAISIVQGKPQLPRHYLYFPDAFVLVYDPSDPSSLDILADIKVDIDKHKEKKEVPIIVLANMRAKNRKQDPTAATPQQLTIPTLESILHRANSWCLRERIKHFTVNAMERPSLYEPIISLYELGNRKK